MDKIIENNQVTVMGEIASEFEFSHEVFGEGFYMLELLVKRLSDSFDRIPVMISERLIDVTQDYRGEFIQISAEDDKVKSNQIFLDGFICKPPVYRKTPLGREIADMLVAVNRPYGKSDYIPCISWGRNARFASNFEVGSRVQIWGRIQSREYVKKLEDDRTEKRTAYEVSVSKMEEIS